MIKPLRISIFFFSFIATILYAQNNVTHITFKQESESIQIILHTTQTYTKSPKLTQQEGYKGIILPDIQSPSRNEKFKETFLSEIQVFNIDENLYILGVGDYRKIKIDMSKSQSAIKIVFSRQEIAPSELEKLMSSSYEPLSTQNQNLSAMDLSKESQGNLSNNTESSQMTNSLLPFKNDLGIETWRYVAVLGVMGGLVIALLLVKRYVMRKTQGKNTKVSFGEYIGRFMNRDGFNQVDIDVVSQKQLDSKHKILTIESNGYRYLILVGDGSTTLIDRYPIPQNISAQEQIQLDEQFAKLLEQKQDRLSKYIHKS